MKWFEVSFNDDWITITRRKLLVLKSTIVIPWSGIIRICFLAGDYIRYDEIYIFTDKRPESYIIPLDAEGSLLLWNEIIKRGLFNAELAIKAASSASDELFCWPPEES